MSFQVTKMHDVQFRINILNKALKMIIERTVLNITYNITDVLKLTTCLSCGMPLLSGSSAVRRRDNYTTQPFPISQIINHFLQTEMIE